MGLAVPAVVVSTNFRIIPYLKYCLIFEFPAVVALLFGGQRWLAQHLRSPNVAPAIFCPAVLT